MRILLYELRIAQGLSERELARRSGISKSTINNIENLRTSPTLDQLSALAKALNVKITDLFDDENK